MTKINGVVATKEDIEYLMSKMLRGEVKITSHKEIWGKTIHGMFVAKEIINYEVEEI